MAQRIARIQVKAGFWCQGHWMHTTKKSNRINGVRGTCPYTRTDFDYLGFDGPQGELYLVPMSELHCSKKNKQVLPSSCSNLHIRYSGYKLNATN